MDIIFLVLGVFIIVISLFSTTIYFDMKTAGHPFQIKYVLCIFFVGLALFGWAIFAINEHSNKKPIEYHIPIEVKYNIPYFVTPNKNIMELQGDKRFVDADKNEIVWTLNPGSWHLGMYVIESTDWKIVPKNVVEKP
jgi:hypothetical protein